MIMSGCIFLCKKARFSHAVSHNYTYVVRGHVVATTLNENMFIENLIPPLTFSTPMTLIISPVLAVQVLT